MKKKITFVYALIFLISLTFCFSGCQTSKKEIYLFSKGDFNYSEKITFKMGSCTQEKNWGALSARRSASCESRRGEAA